MKREVNKRNERVWFKTKISVIVDFCWNQGFWNFSKWVFLLVISTCYTITTNLLRFSNLTISYAQIATKQISATNVRLYKKQSVTWSKQSSAIHHTFFLVKVLKYMHCFLSCNNAYMHCSLLQVQCICFNKQPVQISLRSRQDVCCNCRRLGPNPIDRFRIYFEKF